MTDTADSIRARLQRYRVMAIVTGTLLVLVFLGLLRYLPFVPRPESLEAVLLTLSQVHGFVYIVYLVACYMLWSRMRWGLGRLAVLALGGIVPVLGFIMERRIAREVTEGLAS